MSNEYLLYLLDINTPPVGLEPSESPSFITWIHKVMLVNSGSQETNFGIKLDELLDKLFPLSSYPQRPATQDIIKSLYQNKDLFYITNEYGIKTINLRNFNEDTQKWETPKAFTRRIQQRQNIYDNTKRRWQLQDLSNKELPNIETIKILQEEADSLLQQLKVVKTKLAQAKKIERQRIKSEVTPLLKNQEGMNF